MVDAVMTIVGDSKRLEQYFAFSIFDRITTWSLSKAFLYRFLD